MPATPAPEIWGETFPPAVTPETPETQAAAPGQAPVLRNWDKYPLFDMKHPDRRLNISPDPDCEAPAAGIPMLFIPEESEPISL